jgi:2-dehydro-3-deoxy-D-arabinonate dehydratase
MIVTRHQTASGPCWAADGKALPAHVTLALLLQLPASALEKAIATLATDAPAQGELLPPIEAEQEVWASGVTYLRSRDARKAESSVADVYQKVYEAERPELFLKATGGRVVGTGQAVRIRPDSTWNVPEPELTLVINRHGEIVGYTAGNDMSSRSIEGENPLYLPQAKIYDGACALGSGIQLARPAELRSLPIGIEIVRNGAAAFTGESSTAQMHRKPEELAACLVNELTFPQGVFLMTGTCVVPGEGFTLRSGDTMRIRVGGIALENSVA